MNLRDYFKLSPLRLGLLLALALMIAPYPAKGMEPYQECSSWFARYLEYQPIAPANSLLKLGNAKHGAMPSKGVRVLLWNAHKHTHADWAKDFAGMRSKADVYMLQEVSTGPMQSSAKGAMTGKEWNIAQSYQTGSHSTGVATGSNRHPISTIAVRSPVYEPLLRTPKASVISEFAIKGRKEKLMVVNVHAINFTSLTKFRAQLDHLLPYIDKHKGPLIVGGDMNTWSPGRIAHLRQVLADHGLTEADPGPSGYLLNLDRVFVRGMKMKKGEVMGDIVSSDHKPLYFEFEYD